MNLKELKAKFIDITGMPAKKAYVVIAAPSLYDHKLRSLADWELVFSAIEFKLVRFEPKPLPDEEWVKELNEIDNEFRSQREKFKQEYSAEFEVKDLENLTSNEFSDKFEQCPDVLAIKTLYRKLSKLHHPDTSGDSKIFNRLNNAYNFALQRIQEELDL